MLACSASISIPTIGDSGDTGEGRVLVSWPIDSPLPRTMPMTSHGSPSNHTRGNAAAVACKVCGAISIIGGVMIAAFGVTQAAFESVVNGLGLVAFGTVLYFGHITETC